MRRFSTLRGGAPTDLPVESRLPGFEGATGWLNSPPLSAEDVRGRVVLADVWTYTCINWLRTLGYVRAWADRYAAHGVVVVGVHSPEFPFEHDVENVRRATRDLDITYPVALDNDFAVWRAFANHYWPALYIADAEGRIRHHQFGEGGYEECERVIQRLLRDAGRTGVGDGLVSPRDEGLEAQADWTTLRSPETYLGYEQAERLVAPAGAELDEPFSFPEAGALDLNQWTLGGDWTIGPRASVLDRAGGGITFRFHARDVNLVLGPPRPGTPVPFRVLVDGQPPGDGHGLDVDEDGRGTVEGQRLYQLVRLRAAIRDRTFEIRFLAPGAEAYVFTFG
jgi:hypothetical protein